MADRIQCKACGSTKIIVNFNVPVNGFITDEVTGVVVYRQRCAECGRPIIMSEVQPYRPRK